MEESLSLEELNAIVNAIYAREARNNKFMAALKGIDLDAGSDSKERFEDVKRRAEARLQGKSEEELEMSEFGIEVITE